LRAKATTLAPVRHKMLDNGTTNPAAGAGYNGDLAIQSVLHFLSSHGWAGRIARMAIIRQMHGQLQLISINAGGAPQVNLPCLLPTFSHRKLQRLVNLVELSRGATRVVPHVGQSGHWAMWPNLGSKVPVT
jgi:hypothetical protein